MVVNDDYPSRGVRKVPQKVDRPPLKLCLRGEIRVKR
jgi:hypothetical protein